MIPGRSFGSIGSEWQASGSGPSSSPPHLTLLQHCTYCTPLHRDSGEIWVSITHNVFPLITILFRLAHASPLQSCPRPVADPRRPQPGLSAANSHPQPLALRLCDETLLRLYRETAAFNTNSHNGWSAATLCRLVDYAFLGSLHLRPPKNTTHTATQRHNMVLVLACGRLAWSILTEATRFLRVYASGSATLLRHINREDSQVEQTFLSPVHSSLPSLVVRFTFVFNTTLAFVFTTTTLALNT
jgi:hypothetical protein